MRIRYAGTEANRNGSVTCLESPQHLTISGATITEIESYIQSKKMRPQPNGSWHEVCWSGPAAPAEVAYVATGTFVTGAILVAAVQGVAGDLYEYEVYVHNEYCGSLPPSTEVSHSDPEGYAALIEATKKTTANEPIDSTNNKSTFKSFLNNVGSTIKDVAVKYGPDILSAVTSRYLMPTQIVRNVAPGLLQPGKPQLLLPWK
jgi:hypothetical protein